MNAKWFICRECNRVVKATSPTQLERHVGHKWLRPLSDAPFWHVFYQPELFVDWVKLKLGDLRERVG